MYSFEKKNNGEMYIPPTCVQPYIKKQIKIYLLILNYVLNLNIFMLNILGVKHIKYTYFLGDQINKTFINFTCINCIL